MQTRYRNKGQTSNNEKGQKRETKAEYDTGLGQFQSRNRVEMKYRPKDLSKVGIVYATHGICLVLLAMILEPDSAEREASSAKQRESQAASISLLGRSSLFRQLHWPSLRWRRSVACLTLFHKLITEPSRATTVRSRVPAAVFIRTFCATNPEAFTARPQSMQVIEATEVLFFQPQPFFGTLSLTTFKR